MKKQNKQNTLALALALALALVFVSGSVSVLDEDTSDMFLKGYLLGLFIGTVLAIAQLLILR